jgi:hypothetical protein
VIVNEQNATIADLSYTFTRCVCRRLYDMWLEVCHITESLVLSDSEDELIWQYQSLGVYSSHSLYSIINFRGFAFVHN